MLKHFVLQWNYRPKTVRRQVYAPQAKILEIRTKDEMRIFEVLFKGVILDFGDEPLKSQSKMIISSFVFLPKSSFGEHKVQEIDSTVARVVRLGVDVRP